MCLFAPNLSRGNYSGAGLALRSPSVLRVLAVDCDFCGCHLADPPRLQELEEMQRATMAMKTWLPPLPRHLGREKCNDGKLGR